MYVSDGMRQPIFHPVCAILFPEMNHNYQTKGHFYSCTKTEEGRTIAIQHYQFQKHLFLPETKLMIGVLFTYKLIFLHFLNIYISCKHIHTCTELKLSTAVKESQNKLT